MDVTPLRTSRDFRLLFLAGTVFYFGAMVSYVAIPFQIYTLTGSNFAVGAVGLVELVPLVVFGLYGGALADHVDRRRLLVVDGPRPRRCSPRCSPSTPSATSPSLVGDLRAWPGCSPPPGRCSGPAARR